MSGTSYRGTKRQCSCCIYWEQLQVDPEFGKGVCNQRSSDYYEFKIPAESGAVCECFRERDDGGLKSRAELPIWNAFKKALVQR